MGANTYSLSTWEGEAGEAGESEVQGHPELLSKFELAWATGDPDLEAIHKNKTQRVLSQWGWLHRCKG